MKIIEKNGKILKVSNEVAYNQVEKSNSAKYLPKSVWKKQVRDIEKVEDEEAKKTKKAAKEETKTKNVEKEEKTESKKKTKKKTE